MYGKNTAKLVPDKSGQVETIFLARAGCRCGLLIDIPRAASNIPTKSGLPPTSNGQRALTRGRLSRPRIAPPPARFASWRIKYINPYNAPARARFRGLVISCEEARNSLENPGKERRGGGSTITCGRGRRLAIEAKLVLPPFERDSVKSASAIWQLTTALEPINTLQTRDEVALVRNEPTPLHPPGEVLVEVTRARIDRRVEVAAPAKFLRVSALSLQAVVTESLQTHPTITESCNPPHDRSTLPSPARSGAPEKIKGWVEWWVEPRSLDRVPARSIIYA